MGSFGLVGHAICALQMTCALAGIAAATVNEAAAQTPIKFSLDFTLEGPSAPFVVGIDRGYDQAEGLDVAIDTATGPRDPITRVASGTEMGFADVNSLIRFRDQNPAAPIKAVLMVYNRPPFSIVTRKSRGVTLPKDLEGKKLGAPAGDAAFAQWGIFVQANGIDASKVAIENVGIPIREPMLAAGQLDAITGLSFSSYVNLKDRGVPIDDVVVLMMADDGVDVYGNAIIVNPKFATDHPDAVKGFRRAFVKSLKSTAKDPAAAVDSVVKRNEVAKKDVELERLNMALRDNILTPQARAEGLGGVDGARFDKAIDQIAPRPRSGDIFDSSSLPPAADRLID
jgi:NitT/TauT family transport system substrate-binding protein